MVFKCFSEISLDSGYSESYPNHIACNKVQWIRDFENYSLNLHLYYVWVRNTLTFK